MKKWIVRFVSLYVFNLLVLLLIGMLLPTVRVGWAVLWASVVLTAATIWLKPVIVKAFSGAKANAARGTGATAKVVEYALVFVVELIIWVLVVWFSAVDVRGFFWGYVLPPLLLLVAWIIYDIIDDKVEARAEAIYDRAEAGVGTPKKADDAAPPSAATVEGRQELNDGMTAEQRKMFDDLGQS